MLIGSDILGLYWICHLQMTSAREESIQGQHITAPTHENYIIEKGTPK